MLTKFVNSISPNVSPLQGNTIEDDERVSFGIVSSTQIGNQIDAIDWSDSIIQRCRFDRTTITNSSFERVAILDCDLSGLTFDNCLLRECVFVGIKANAQLCFENCILDRVMMARCRTDVLDIYNSRLVEMNFLGMESTEINFHQCQAHKRKGRVSFEECECTKIAGLDVLGNDGIEVQVDKPLWRALGDYYLKERGIKPLNDETAGNTASHYALLDQIGLS